MSARERLASLPDCQLLAAEAHAERLLGPEAIREAVTSLRQSRRVVEAARRCFDSHTYDTESQ